MEQLCFGVVAWIMVYLVWYMVEKKYQDKQDKYVCEDCAVKKKEATWITYSC